MTASKKTRLKGRKSPEGSKRQFLTTMDPEVIKALKTAAIRGRHDRIRIDGRSRHPMAGAAKQEEVIDRELDGNAVFSV